jgi:nucleoside-diphosphate-sugar epimerase
LEYVMSRGRVLVTGATGFIAKHCIAELLREGYEVRATLRDVAMSAGVRDAVARALGGPCQGASKIEFVQANLVSDAGWPEAVAGCRFVLHVASPFPLRDPKSRDELVVPARDGALRLLRAAAAAGVERVVLTSSMAAICYTAGPAPDRAMTEDDWTDDDRPELTAYLVSKTIAERTAWDWVRREGNGMGLVSINPGLVLGPALDDDVSSSVDTIRIYTSGRYPALPPVSYPISDVRDVARMHVLAMSHPAAGGRRWICSDGDLTVAQIMGVVGDTLPDLKGKIPSFVAPGWVIRLLALYDRGARSLIPDLGRRNRLDNSKAREKLGMEFHSARDAVRAASLSLRELGLV